MLFLCWSLAEGEGLIACFEGHLYKLLVSEYQRFTKIFTQAQIIFILNVFCCFVHEKKQKCCIVSNQPKLHMQVLLGRKLQII